MTNKAYHSKNHSKTEKKLQTICKDQWHISVNIQVIKRTLQTI